MRGQAEVYHRDGERSVSRIAIEELQQKLEGQGFYAVFADRDALLQSELQNLLAAKYGIPERLWHALWYRLNGYSGASTHPPDLKASWLRFLIKDLDPYMHEVPPTYTWYEASFLFSENSNGCTTLFCFDVPNGVRLNMIAEFDRLNEIGRLLNLATLEAFVMEQVVYLYDRSLWTIRDWIRSVELARNGWERRDVDFTELHDLARHAIHTSECLKVAVDSATALTRLRDDDPATHPLVGKDGMEASLMTWTQALRNLLQRSDSLKERLSNEIQLAYNLVAVRDSRSMFELSLASQRDSAAMRVIAVVTLAFLPATFVSTLFSMSFFDYSSASPDGHKTWTVSSQFWIYWVIAVPLTVLTIISWTLGQKRSVKKAKAV